MRIFEIPSWIKAVSATVPHVECACGIAFGPGSDEGLVLCNGSLLQAGRVLPIRGDYLLTKVRGVTGDNSAYFPTDAIASCEVMVFESPAELAIAGGISRPQRTYHFGGPLGVGVPGTVPGPGIAVLNVPMVGRRHVQVQVGWLSGDLDFNYSITGFRIPNAFGALTEAMLATGTATFAINPDSSLDPFTFYLDDEVFDVMCVQLWQSSGAASVTIDATAIGEWR